MQFDPDSQECDRLRELMEAANRTGPAPFLSLEGRAALEIIFQRRLARDSGVIIRVLAEMASGEMTPNDLVIRRALSFLNELRFDWSLAPVIFDPLEFGSAEFQNMFGEKAA